MNRLNVSWRWFAAILTMAWASLAPGQDTSPQPTNAPRWFCAQPTFDFGEKDDSTSVVHEFRIQNVGTAPLSIRGVRTSCGCTAAQPSTNVVAPGGETVIKATLSLAGRRGMQNKSIHVDTNDPLQPAATLILNGTAVTELSVEPAFVNFGNVQQGTNAEREVRLTSRMPGVRITDVKCDSAAFRVETLPPVAGQPPGVKVSTVPPLPFGESRGLLRMVTDNPRRPEITATVRAVVPPEVRVLPDELIVHGAAGEVAPGIALLIIPGSVRDYEVLTVDAPSTNIVARFKQSAPGTYRIDLLNFPTGPELSGKSIRITTSLPTMKEIAVPIRHVP